MMFFCFYFYFFGVLAIAFVVIFDVGSGVVVVVCWSRLC